MLHDTSLITTVTLALAFAFIAGLIASRLRLPTIVGYLVAGMAIGPFTPGVVADAALTQQLAEIGVVLLLFGVGIHFSIKDLMAVRSIAVPGAIGWIAIASLLGIVLGQLLGWGIAAGLVLGLAVSVSSTVVLLRALGERDELGSVHGRIAIGWVIVEDLFTVLILVLLPAFAVAQGSEQAVGLAAGLAGESLVLAVALAVGKVAILGTLMLVIGSKVVPYLLVLVARTGSRELFTLGVLAIALGIAYASSVVFGVSLALGAFLAGVVVSESDLSHQAAADALPLRDAFAVLFFVSVGMLFDPAALLATPGPALAVLGIVMIGKPFVAMLMVLIFGYPVRSALTVAAGLAQIGEFSFIVAELGRTLGLLPGVGYALVIGGAILSITFNSLVFRSIAPIDARLRNHKLLQQYLQWRSGDLARMADYDGGEDRGVRGHAVICGFGRVGSVVADALERRQFPYVVIEQQRRRVERLRERGIKAINGDAGNPSILELTHLAQARILVVTIPDPPAARQILAHARKVNPRLDVIVRTGSMAERDYLYSQGSGEVVIGEMEIGLEMARHTLHRFGLGSTEALAIIQSLRLDRGQNSSADGKGP